MRKVVFLILESILQSSGLHLAYTFPSHRFVQNVLSQESILFDLRVKISFQENILFQLQFYSLKYHQALITTKLYGVLNAKINNK